MTINLLKNSIKNERFVAEEKVKKHEKEHEELSDKEQAEGIAAMEKAKSRSRG